MEEDTEDEIVEKRNYLKEIADNTEKIFEQARVAVWLLLAILVAILYSINK